MKHTLLRILICFSVVLFLGGCAKTPEVIALASPSVTEEVPPTDIPAPTADPMPELPAEGGGIFLYGEWHSDAACIERELELWDHFYARGMRHLFTEGSYYGAEFLNLWMAADNDEILDQLYEDSDGTPGHSETTLLFYRTIKENNPETVFHGIDVGHQYDTTGKRYLEYLESIGQKDSEAYTLAEENINQGKEFYRLYTRSQWQAGEYRDQCMAENFRREYDKLGNENIMGIFGYAHVVTSAQASSYFSPETVTMAMMLEESYGSRIRSTLLPDEVYRDSGSETMTVNGKEYVAERCATMDNQSKGMVEGNQSQVFWKLLDAYEDLKDCPLNEEKANCFFFPMLIEPNQVYVVDFIKLNGEMERHFYRTDEAILSFHEYFPSGVNEYYANDLIIPGMKAESPGV